MPSLSPQVQSAQQGPPPPEQAEQMFKEQFTQTAYSVLFSKFPDIAPEVITFKILEVDPDSGDGMGAFIVLREDRPIYIPVIMVNGQLKPVEIFYFKDLNIFLPLDNMWLEEIAKMSLNDMGESAERPKDVPQDVDIQGLVRPPLAGGRFGYASDPDYDLLKMVKESQDHHLEVHPSFLDVIKQSPQVVLDGVKLAFERHPYMLQKLVKNYGTTAITEAFQTGYAQVKEAAAPPEVGIVKLFTKEASSEMLKEAFGSSAGDAFSRILTEGYIVKDTRKDLTKIAVKVEGPAILDSPGATGGWFRLFFVDAPADIFFVIPWPKCADRYGMPTTYSRNGNHRKPTEYLVINKDAKEAWVADDVMGEVILDESDVTGSKLYKLLGEGAGDTPTPKSFGFFLNATPKAVEATIPFEIEYAVDEGGRKKVIGQYGSPTWVTDDDPSRICIDTLKEHNIGFLPKNIKWIEIVKVKARDNNLDSTIDYADSSAFRNRRRTSLIKDPKLMMRWLNGKLHENNAETVNVKKASRNEWWVNGSDRALPWLAALPKVAMDYGVSIEDAEGILKEAQTQGVSSAYILDAQTGRQLLNELEKVAQPPQQQMPQQQMPQGQMQQQMPQGQQGMMPPDQMGMMQPQQPTMSPTDLAIAETVDMLRQQNDMQLQQQQQSMEQGQQQSEQLIGVLEQIQQRSQEITDATGGMIPPEAAGSPATAAGMLAPPVEEPPPTPMLDGELSPQMVAEQLNPQYLEDAEGLQDSGVFDTAALAMLSSAPVLQDIVSAYVPNMEKCLDNIGRILLTLWMTEGETKEAIGDEAYITLEDKLRTIFKGLGDVILTLSRSVPNPQAQDAPLV